MLPAFASKAWHMMTLLTEGMVIVVLVACQLHVPLLDLALPSPLAYHHAPSPDTGPAPASHTTHTTLNCFMGVLPSLASSAPVSLVMPYISDLLSHPAGFASPPFIPPKAAVY